MKRIIALTALGLGIAAIAQTAPKPAAPPTITDAHKAAYFKAQLQLTQAQSALGTAQAKMQAAVGEMVTDCGNGFLAQLDPNGDPVCAAKPASPAAPKPAPAAPAKK